MSEQEKVAVSFGHLGYAIPTPSQVHQSCVQHHKFREYIGDSMLPKVSPMTEETKAKIREMSQADVPIGERRALYNQLGRRMKHSGLKPGLVQKYTACLGNSKERFQLLKEFLIDENLLDTEVIYMDVWFHTDTNGGKVIYG